jgi:dTMP kinase
MKNQFITLEGIEGSGKSTQMQLTQDYLEQSGCHVVRTREPGGTELSEKIRDLLLSNQLQAMHEDTELLLMFAARVEHVRKVIEPALDKGYWVLSDRFYDATYAYQGYGRGIDAQKIDQLRDFSLSGLQPDKTFLLDVSLSASQQRVSQRGEKDRFEKEKLDFYSKVRQGYLELAEQNSQRICVIDAEQEITQVQSDIQVHLKAMLVNR